MLRSIWGVLRVFREKHRDVWLLGWKIRCSCREIMEAVEGT